MLRRRSLMCRLLHHFRLHIALASLGLLLVALTIFSQAEQAKVADMDDATFNRRVTEWRMMPGDMADPAYVKSVYMNELDTKFQALCSLFLQARQDQREQLPLIFAPNGQDRPYSDWMFNLDIYARSVSLTNTDAQDAGSLELGLAAIAIANSRSDFREDTISMAHLRYRAEIAGIDWMQSFDRIAAMASPKVGEDMRRFARREPSNVKKLVVQFPLERRFKAEG